jgi:hypothetical protein
MDRLRAREFTRWRLAIPERLHESIAQDARRISEYSVPKQAEAQRIGLVLHVKVVL